MEEAVKIYYGEKISYDVAVVGLETPATKEAILYQE